MRIIAVGTEYAGKSTLLELLGAYYRKRGRRVHMDDHFSLPDSTLSAESRAAMLGFANDVKERSQRMQIHYHIDVLQGHENVLLSGWHIEEAVYTGLYGEDPDSPYYPNYNYHHFQRRYEYLTLEARLPDLVLLHVSASDEAIGARMKADPHQYPIVREEHIAESKRRFEEEVGKSLFTSAGRMRELDTTGQTPQESLDELLLLTEPLVTPGEVALRALPVPEGECEICYENGIRKVVAKEG